MTTPFPPYTMSTSFSQDALVRLSTLCRHPTREMIHALTPNEFVQLVAYVFSKAGYLVQQHPQIEHSADLFLYTTNGTDATPQAAVIIRHQVVGDSSLPISFNKSSHTTNYTKLYIITSEEFTLETYRAYREASTQTLINGQRWMRYMLYATLAPQTLKSTTQSVFPVEDIFAADAIERQLPSQTSVITFASLKGGTGKTTSVLYLARLLARNGDNVLVVDMDAQGSLGEQVTEKHLDTLSSLSDYFQGSTKLANLVTPTIEQNIWLLPPPRKIPSYQHSIKTLLQFVSDIHASTLTTPTGEPFRWILFDTAPKGSWETCAALAVSHFVLIPNTLYYEAIVSVNIVFQWSSAIQGLMGTGAHVLALLTRGTNTELDKQRLAQIQHQVDLGNRYHLLLPCTEQASSWRLAKGDDLDRSYLLLAALVHTFSEKKELLADIGD